MRSRIKPGLGLCVLIIVSASLAGACASTTRYRVLTFFFDGVPEPGSQDASAAHLDDHAAPFSAQTLGLASVDIPAAPMIVSVHEPVRERRCTACHDMQSAMTLMANSMQLCDQCHKADRVEQNWDHGPINLGSCLPCHRAHDSPFPHLLDQPVPALCATCHAEDMNRTEPYHTGPRAENCTACHHPHRRGEIVANLGRAAIELPGPAPPILMPDLETGVQ